MTQEEFISRYTYSVSNDRIGGGGFGTVYRAKDNVLHRTVAIKVSEVKTTIDGKKTFSLKDEFEALSHVPKHKNIANYEELYSFEMPNGVFDYAVMQYYPDGNLSNAIKQGLSEEQKEEVARQLLDGIGFLHEHKVVHRDLKPSNILIVWDGYDIIPLITDFGLSKTTKGGELFTNSFGGGTQRYSSPEQLQGKPLRFNTDLWSYGAIVYELFTGETLFSPSSGALNSAQADLEVYNKIIRGDVQSINKMPERWRRVAERCLVVDPERRAKSADELRMILNSEDDATFYQSGATPIPTPVPPYQQPYNPPTSQPSYPPTSQPSYPPTSQPAYQQPYQQPNPPTSQPGYQQPYQPPYQQTPQPVYTTPQPSSGGGKKGNGVWIVIAVFLAALIGGLLFMVLQNPEKKAVNACKTANDYRGYIQEYGKKGRYYDMAMQQIQTFVDDSIAKAKLEAEKLEDAVFAQCTTVAACDIYLQTYPNGRYVQEVQKKKADLELKEKEDAAFKNCTSLAGCNSYLRDYPNGRYVSEVNAKKAVFEQQAEEIAYEKCTTIAGCNNYLRDFPNGRYVTEVKAKKAQLEAENQSGVFSVSTSSSVRFSSGNLQYQASTGQWRIAPNPWDYVGEGNSNISSYYSGWIDMFGWGTGNNPTRSSSNNSDYSYFSDWGSKYGSGWRTLSQSEWEYVFDQRTTSSGIRWARATVSGVKGIILVPDNWSRSTYSLNGTNDGDSGFNSNIISASTWRSTFAPKGAVFLPAAGYREGYKYSDANNVGYYVTSTSYDNNNNYMIFIGNTILDVKCWGNRLRGRSVRLVRSAGSSPVAQTGQTTSSISQTSSKSGSQTFTVKGVPFVMKPVEGGTFMMGDQDRKPIHTVTLSSYYISETLVTQGLWKAVMGKEATYGGGWEYQYGRGDNYPAYRVTWNECQEFIRKLNQLTGKNFRMPTEAEWEYAARGGRKSQGYTYAGSNNIGDVAWYRENSGGKTHPVKGKRANELGLYDMSGNVYEWCADWSGEYSSGSQTNPKGPSSGSSRVLRGGGFDNSSSWCKSTFRDAISPTSARNDFGFRLVLVQ